MLWDGLSPAIVLAKTVLEMARKGVASVPLPAEVDRARIVRLLSVFVSQLDSVAGPGEPNHEICKQASSAVSYALDELLKGPQAHPGASLGTEDGAAVLDEFDPGEWASLIDWAGGHHQSDWPFV